MSNGGAACDVCGGDCCGAFCERGAVLAKHAGQIEMVGQLATQSCEAAVSAKLASERTETFVRGKLDELIVAHQADLKRAATTSSTPPNLLGVPLPDFGDIPTGMLDVRAQRKLRMARLKFYITVASLVLGIALYITLKLAKVLP